jgi:8-oxo-dGTP pyrophosphatase MutT (NUDIX family)
MPETRIRPSVYGISFTEDRGQVLLTRDGVSHIWELPGGGVDPGERATGALAREILEETGLAATLGPAIYFADEYYHYPPHTGDETWYSVLMFYLVHTEGSLDPAFQEDRSAGRGSNYGAAWVPVDELDGLDVLPNHYDAIQRALLWLEATEGPVATDDDDD